MTPESSPSKARTKIDYECDGEVQDVFFKSLDGEVFSICKERVSNSVVWKDMLKMEKETAKGEEMKDEDKIAKAIGLEESTIEVSIYLHSLIQDQWMPETLPAYSVVLQLRMADNYQAIKAALFVPSMVEIEGPWNLEEVMLVFHYGWLFNLQTLKNKAAKKSNSIYPNCFTSSLGSSLRPEELALRGIHDLRSYDGLQEQCWMPNSLGERFQAPITGIQAGPFGGRTL